MSEREDWDAAATRLRRALTAEQRADAERFGRFWDAWPQDAADVDPDEWWRAEQMRTAVLEILGVETPVRVWAEWLRACELFDELGRPEMGGAE